MEPSEFLCGCDEDCERPLKVREYASEKPSHRIEFEIDGHAVALDKVQLQELYLMIGTYIGAIKL